ncbi:MAG: hypothetical protein ABIZ69_09370, partial [Ilumatobacteraceae bacterium]
LAPVQVAHGDESTLGTFALDATDCSKKCSSCHACKSHGANKMFKTEAAATAGRAHVACDCIVTAGQSLTRGVHAKVFQLQDTADRRNAATAALLSANVDQHPVPLVSGFVPLVVLGGGAAGIVWLMRRRDQPLRAG